MAYPPSTLGTTFADATALATTHPAAHNDANAAINDIVAELGGAGLSGAGYSTLEGRLLVLSSMVAGVIDPVVGRYYDGQNFGSLTPSTQTMTASTIYGSPFMVGKRMSVDRFAVNRTSAAPASAGGVKLALYDSDADGFPTSPLLQPTALSIAASAAAAASEATVSLQLEPGKIYWTMCKADQAYVMASFAQACIAPWGGFAANNSSGYVSRIQRTHTYATAWPDPFTLVAADFNSNAGISLRLRVATVG